MGTVTYPSLERIAQDARTYPAHLLEGCETGLVLFSAAFLGHNDAIHFAQAGLETTCIDIDARRLQEMAALYPSDWTFLVEDAWTFAESACEACEQWDAVSADTFTGDAMAQSMASLDLWCSLARKFVTVTATGGAIREAPEGWNWSLMRRAGPREDGESVYWMILERK